jgi:hypothetical protein
MGSSDVSHTCVRHMPLRHVVSHTPTTPYHLRVVRSSPSSCFPRTPSSSLQSNDSPSSLLSTSSSPRNPFSIVAPCPPCSQTGNSSSSTPTPPRDSAALRVFSPAPAVQVKVVWAVLPLSFPLSPPVSPCSSLPSNSPCRLGSVNSNNDPSPPECKAEVQAVTTLSSTHRLHRTRASSVNVRCNPPSRAALASHPR